MLVLAASCALTAARTAVQAPTRAGDNPAMTVFAVLVRRATWTAVSLIVIAIALVVSDANATNAVAAALRDAGAWLARPFDGLFAVRDPTTGVALNWAVAAVAYAVAGRLVARLAASS